MKSLLYIVTGANGHLGNTIIRYLKKWGQPVRGLILPSEQAANRKTATYYKGDVRLKKDVYKRQSPLRIPITMLPILKW